MGGDNIPLSSEMTYLGVTIEKSLLFKSHVRNASVKAEKIGSQLARLMPNIGGPTVLCRSLRAVIWRTVLGSHLGPSSRKCEGHQQGSKEGSTSPNLCLSHSVRSSSERHCGNPAIPRQDDPSAQAEKDNIGDVQIWPTRSGQQIATAKMSRYPAALIMRVQWDGLCAECARGHCLQRGASDARTLGTTQGAARGLTGPGLAGNVASPITCLRIARRRMIAAWPASSQVTRRSPTDSDRVPALRDDWP